MNNHTAVSPVTSFPDSYRRAGLTLSACLLLSACATPATSPDVHNQSMVTTGPVVALVLGGGGAKGFAHIGVIKVLEENNITPNLVVGTSVGSFVGSLYASGKSADELEALALSVRDSELTDPTLSYQGVIEGLKLRNFVNNQVNNAPIQSFPIPFAAVAAEKHSLKKAVFTEGNAGLVVQASSSVPNIFIAPRIPDPAISGIVGKKYVDGGVVSIVPVDTAKSLGADIVIAVDLQVGTGEKSTPPSTQTSTRSIWSLLEQGYSNYANNTRARNQQSSAYAQNYQAVNRAEIARADVLIQPDVSGISTINTLDREQAIAAGELAAQQSLPAIMQAIQKAKVEYQPKASR